MKNHRDKKSCRKLAYHSKERAREELKALRHTGVKRFYKCPHCSTKPSPIFHLTSEEK